MAYLINRKSIITGCDPLQVTAETILNPFYMVEFNQVIINAQRACLYAGEGEEGMKWYAVCIILHDCAEETWKCWDRLRELEELIKGSYGKDLRNVRG